MPDLWFFAGLAIGAVLAGFSALVASEFAFAAAALAGLALTAAAILRDIGSREPAGSRP